MNDNHSPIEIPENWDFYRTSFGETPVSIRLNLALKSIAPIADFPVVVRAIVKMQHPYDNGFSSQEEFDKGFLFVFFTEIYPVVDFTWFFEGITPFF